MANATRWLSLLNALLSAGQVCCSVRVLVSHNSCNTVLKSHHKMVSIVIVVLNSFFMIGVLNKVMVVLLCISYQLKTFHIYYILFQKKTLQYFLHHNLGNQ